MLPNGNIVVTDPGYDAPGPSGPIIDVGAVYLYNGATGALISTLTGSTAGDQVGNRGVTVLANGDYVVQSLYWHNGDAPKAGAVTWGNSVTGVSGVVSKANSLVGSNENDMIGCVSYLDCYGGEGVVALSNGNYVVGSATWDNGATADAGAVTWGNGATGVSGAVSPANSLVGSTAGDRVGDSGMVALSNGNYIVRSPYWHNGVGAVTWGSAATGVIGPVSSSNSLVGSNYDEIGSDGVTALNNGNYVVASSRWNDEGAVTWGNGTVGVNGVVSPANSLVGSAIGDSVGSNGVIALNNGNYAVVSCAWNGNSGAVTWGNGVTGVQGSVSAANSLVGSTTGDKVGYNGVTSLSNGNYIVASPYWKNGTAAAVGAATWGNGATGMVGTVSVANSLVGSTDGDNVASGDVTALTNGNYVVASPKWYNATAASAGAVTWGNGATGIIGTVSAANSLVGSTAGDNIGSVGVTAFINGNYVVASPNWKNGMAIPVGAATWGNGTTGISGPVSAVNSLVGSTELDQVGSERVTALSNGNYVVASIYWQNGTLGNAGAVTFGNGTTGISGAVTTANGLVGSTAGDLVGAEVTALTNGNYVVASIFWQNSAAVEAGAVTWGNGVTGTTGTVSAANSLVGSIYNDEVGEVTALKNGNYVVRSPTWHNGVPTFIGVGAITPGAGAGPNCACGLTAGPITAANSVISTVVNEGFFMNFPYDPINHQFVINRPIENIVTLFAYSCDASTHWVFLPMINR